MVFILANLYPSRRQSMGKHDEDRDSMSRRNGTAQWKGTGRSCFIRSQDHVAWSIKKKEKTMSLGTLADLQVASVTVTTSGKNVLSTNPNGNFPLSGSSITLGVTP